MGIVFSLFDRIWPGPQPWRPRPPVIRDNNHIVEAEPELEAARIIMSRFPEEAANITDIDKLMEGWHKTARRVAQRHMEGEVITFEESIPVLLLGWSWASQFSSAATGQRLLLMRGNMDQTFRRDLMRWEGRWWLESVLDAIGESL